MYIYQCVNVYLYVCVYKCVNVYVPVSMYLCVCFKISISSITFPPVMLTFLHRSCGDILLSSVCILFEITDLYSSWLLISLAFQLGTEDSAQQYAERVLCSTGCRWSVWGQISCFLHVATPTWRWKTEWCGLNPFSHIYAAFLNIRSWPTWYRDKSTSSWLCLRPVVFLVWQGQPAVMFT